MRCILTLMLVGALPLGVAHGQMLPLGDGRVTNQPLVGNVYPCRTTFRPGGARHDGPWIHGERWSPLEKPHVAGRVMWPNAFL